MTGLPVDTVTKSRGWVRNAYLSHLREKGLIGQPVRRRRLRFPIPYPEARGAAAIRCSTASAARCREPMSAYARDELGFKTDMTYNLLASDIVEVGMGRRPRSAGRRATISASFSR